MEILDSLGTLVEVSKHFHENNILFAKLDIRNRDVIFGSLFDALEVAHFLLHPEFNQLAVVRRILVAEAEAVVARDVLLPVFEHQNRGLEDLDGARDKAFRVLVQLQFAYGVGFELFGLNLPVDDGVLHVGFLACGDAPVHFV